MHKSKNIIFDYKNIPKVIPDNEIQNNKNSDLLHKLLRDDDINKLVMDNINLKNNNDLFEKMEKKKNIFDLYQNFHKNDTFSQINEDEIILEQKNKNFNNKLIHLYRLHSSKFHPKKNENSRNINEVFNKQINLLKKERNNIWNDSYFNNKNQKIIKNMNIFRKNIAFRYRFLNNSTKNKNIKNNFKSKNKQMNKILQISKSIPDILYQEIKSMQNIKNINISNDNDNKLEGDNFFLNKKIIKDYGFNSPFKGNRYIGNIYDYYKSNNCLNEKYLIFSPRQNDNFISEKINQIANEENNSSTIFSINKKNNKRNDKIKGAKIKKNEKSGMIHLNSLLM